MEKQTDESQSNQFEKELGDNIFRLLHKQNAYFYFENGDVRVLIHNKGSFSLKESISQAYERSLKQKNRS